MNANTRTAISGAIRKLTAAHDEHVTVRVAGGGRRIVTVGHEPLITRLEAGLLSTSAGYGGSSPQARNVIDADTLQKLDALRGDTIKLWKQLLPGSYRLLPLRTDPLVESLSLWHTLFTFYADRELIPAGHATFAQRVTVGWMNTIELKFSPPHTIEGTTPCPVCRSRWTTPGDLEDRLSAIVFTFTGLASEAKASCRACGVTWQGRVELEALDRQFAAAARVTAN
jgi:hypothetical protein